MPAETFFEQQGLDENPIIVKRFNLPIGQNSNDCPEAIAEHEVALLQNADLSKNGVRKTRAGKSTGVGTSSGTAAVLGLNHFYPEGGTKLLTRYQNGAWQKWDGTTGWTNLVTGLAVGRANFVIGSKKILLLEPSQNVRSYDGTTVVDEGNGATDPPRTLFGIYHKNKAILSGNTTDRSFIYPSDTLDITTFDATKVLKVADQDNGEMRALVNLSLTTNHGFIAFKDNATFFVDSANADPVNWSIILIDAAHGCFAGRTAVAVGSTRSIGQSGDVIYVSREGQKFRVRSLIRTVSDALHNAGVLSDAIEDVLDAVSDTNMSNASAFYFDDKYILSIPSGSSTFNDTVCVLDLKSSIPSQGFWKWTIFKGWSIDCFSVFEDNGIEDLYGGEADGTDTEVYKLFSGTSDSGTAIQFIEEGRREDFGFPELRKTFEHVEVQFLATDVTLVTVLAQIDGGGFSTLGTVDVGGGGPTLAINLPFDLSAQARVRAKFPLDGLGTGRDVQVRVEHSDLDKTVSYLGNSVAAFLTPLELQ